MYTPVRDPQQLRALGSAGLLWYKSELRPDTYHRAAWKRGQWTDEYDDVLIERLAEDGCYGLMLED